MIHTKHFLALLLACTVTYMSGQEKDNIKAISNEACKCLYEISLDSDKEARNKEIKNCITQAIIIDQMQATMANALEKTKDTIEKIGLKNIDSLSISDKENANIIIADKNYNEIEEYTLRNCDAMKTLMATNNKEHENSYSDRKKAKKLYEEGNEFYARGQYEKAILKYKKAVKKDKKFAFCWDNLGICYRKIGNYQEAVNCYKKSLALDPKGEVPLMNLPVAYGYLEQYDNAIEAYQKMIQIHPENPEGYYGISRIYILTQKNEEALDNVMKAYILYVEQKSPYNQDAQKLIGMLYQEFKKNDDMDTFLKIAKKHKININTEE